jgi:glycosyltransferase involved in cell wall biosynthesis
MNIPAPYRRSLYERIRTLLHEQGGSLTIIFAARIEPSRQWPAPIAADTPDVIFLNDSPLRIGRKSTYVNPLVARALSRSRPDVVVLGGFAPWIYVAAAWCWATHTPYIMWSGETVASARTLRWRTRIRRPLVRHARGYLGYGPAARDYIVATGGNADLITVLGNAIDIDEFAARVNEARNDRAAIRARFGFDGKVVASIGGKDFERALAVVDAMDRDVHLAVVGRHPSGRVHEQLVELGRLEADEMPAFYAAVDCVIHTPDWERFDRWPHAINEALSAGIPVVASRRTGIPDGVFSGPGCALVDPRVDAIAPAVKHALEVSSNATEAVREAIRAPLRPWGVDRMAERFVSAAGQALTLHSEPS